MITNTFDFSETKKLLETYGKDLPSAAEASEILTKARVATDSARAKAEEMDYHHWAAYGGKIGGGLSQDREALANAEHALSDIETVLVQRFPSDKPMNVLSCRMGARMNSREILEAIFTAANGSFGAVDVKPILQEKLGLSDEQASTPCGGTP